MGKIGSTSSPPIQKMGSWGSSQMSATYTPIFPTTYTEERLVGKLGSTSSPPIQKTGSWGSWQKRPLITSPELPHHLYRRRARGEARVNFPTTYTEYANVR